MNSAKASERQEGSGLKGEAWRSREAQPGKVREVLEGERWVKYILTENVRGKNLEGLSRDKVESRGVGEVESSQLAQARELSVAKNLRFISVNRLIQNVSFKPTENQL